MARTGLLMARMGLLTATLDPRRGRSVHTSIDTRQKFCPSFLVVLLLDELSYTA
jgi:hypothetical protein